ncbi:protein EARLY FLOWERING 4-like [Amaranthus tricolor]|uniref:protein EARLY FLOWERING 4-like n=1 Tax=Amaranthus tricolor TaxID=29722 RepID=UPI00258DF5A1|nr:protein EARLY FLOWERING 4-like [Amaranthus tricolor]
MSYSGAESSMEDVVHRQNGSVGGAGNRRHRMKEYGGDSCGDPEAWNDFADSFSRVQTVLDRNRELIQQANENHQSRIPDNMVKNVAIIQELNGNISKVASIYSDLSTNFTGRVRQQRQKGGNSNGRRNGDE